MGCFHGKPAVLDDNKEIPNVTQSSRGFSETRLNRINSSRTRDSLRSKDGDKRLGLFDMKLSGSNKVRDVTNSIRKTDNFDQVVLNHPGIRVVPRALVGEQIAAGWPSWLASAASEAINGWVPLQVDTFEKIAKIGQGTYSSVYKARDLTHNKIVALKKVRFDKMDSGSVKFMAREILILRKFDHPNIIKLEGLIAGASGSLYLVFEYMEHDLTGLASLPESKFTEPQVKCYMKQLLNGLDHCHSRGVLHRDIKGSNLLIDNNGILKIADFGLAAFFEQDQSQSLTSRVVTLWYRPPELLLGATYYGVSVDLWSAGCILGELYASKPIMPGRTEVEQLHKIFKLCGSPSEAYWAKSNFPYTTGFKPVQPYKRRLAETFKDFPPVAVGLMETLLAIDPAHRGTASDALKSEFFTTAPLPCDPSVLPKYAPSKEMDVKLREEESKRQRKIRASRVPRADQEPDGPKSSQILPESNANAELVAAMQRRQGNPTSNGCNQLSSLNHHQAAPGLPLDTLRVSHRAKECNKDQTDHDPRRISHSGPLVSGDGWARSGKRCDDIPNALAKPNLSTSSRLVASRISEDPQHGRGRPLDPLGLAGPTGRSDHLFIRQSIGGSRQNGKGRAGSKESVLGHGMKKNKNHFSGPLLVTKNNVDQMLKEHDRQIHETARRSRIDRGRLFNNR